MICAEDTCQKPAVWRVKFLLWPDPRFLPGYEGPPAIAEINGFGLCAEHSDATAEDILIPARLEQLGYTMGQLGCPPPDVKRIELMLERLRDNDNGPAPSLADVEEGDRFNA